jgi:hypothetical protein
MKKVERKPHPTFIFIVLIFFQNYDEKLKISSGFWSTFFNQGHVTFEEF